MEAEAGPQVAPPLYLHSIPHSQFYDAAPSPLPRKRGLPWSTGHNPSIPNQRIDYTNSWNPDDWEWDNVRLTAQPANGTAPLVASVSSTIAAVAQPERLRSAQGGNAAGLFVGERETEDDGLQLKLGQVIYPAAEERRLDVPETTAEVASETNNRHSKKLRSGSHGSSGGTTGGKNGSNSSSNGCGSGSNGVGGGNYPMCQVDDCHADLSSAKDYHRRHKVCDAHSKSTKACVAGQMQRFCQQCSRFHPLAEFDEGKRSCRRRLAGHNRRRRKSQPTETAPHLSNPVNQDSAAHRNLEIVNLLTVLAQLQGSITSKKSTIPAVPSSDIVQILSNICSLGSSNVSPRPNTLDPDHNASQGPQHVSVDQALSGMNKQGAPSTLNLLSALSVAMAPSLPENACNSGCSDTGGSDKQKEPSVELYTDTNIHYQAVREISSSVIRVSHHEIGSQSIQSGQQAQEISPSLSLRLCTVGVDEPPPKVDSSTKYLSSESSNPLDERSPSSSSPVTHKFFPDHSVYKEARNTSMADDGEDNITVEASTCRAWCAPLELFREAERPAENGSPQDHMYAVGHAITSDSDHSPSLSNSEPQDRTGRIVFKLFGKEPSTIPENIRDQVLSWLKHSPIEMEGYIRPGCLVLSMYLSMPVIMWNQLEENILHRVNLLVHNPESDFWRKGRFLVRTKHQMVSHKDGIVRLSKSWRTLSTPELKMVSPVAVVFGQKTSLTLKGRNLTVPGTKIHCTFLGKYVSKEVLCSAYPGTIYDDSSVESFEFPGEHFGAIGRCFIEVENGFKGNSFPVIIANSSICLELRTVEVDLEGTHIPDVNSDYRVQGIISRNSREDALQFLNELGWLFQRAGLYAVSPNQDSLIPYIDFSVIRFKYLLVFSVERDWCALVKTILEILAKQTLRGSEARAQETVEMLADINLPIRAVKRRCRKMVDLLLHFSVAHADDSVVYPFPPNLPSSGGFTPLHLAASSEGMHSIVDALTNDPQQIGLCCWDKLLDDSGNTPQMYAACRSYDLYNKLVEQKQADKKNRQVSITVADTGISLNKPCVLGENNLPGLKSLPARTCSQCAMIQVVRGSHHSRGVLSRPYVHSLLAVAAVCVCVCVVMRFLLRINSGRSFKWERLDFGAI